MERAEPSLNLIKDFEMMFSWKMKIKPWTANQDFENRGDKKCCNTSNCL